MLKKQDWLQEELKSVSKQLILEQFKLFANDLALKNLYTKLQTERFKKNKFFTLLNEAIKQNIDCHIQLADARKQQDTETATNSLANVKNY